MQSPEGDRSGERVGRGDIYPTIGEPAERLNAAASVFGQPLIEAVLGLVQDRPGLKASVILETLGENPQRLTLNFATDEATQKLVVTLSGDWTTAEVPRGTPLLAGYSGRFSWKNPRDGNPIAKPDDRISPEGPIGVGTRGKGLTFFVRLSGEKFPRGARFVKHATVDGQDVEPGTVLCYVEEVEEMK